ncbi:MAG: 3-deoxy-8-phosphooctulonate synthase [Desulfosarcina sp.]|nr:3-deoxy-8-phosphooctulonate synthase [Desulfosarcina sp.]
MKPESPFFLVSGPCVIEDEAVTLRIATRLKELTDSLGIPFTFKASYDKANRTAITSFRGPGIRDGLRVLAKVKETLAAFLCRQTDLILAVAKTGKPVNVKKGQFLAPWDMVNIVNKIRSVSSVQPMITERGVMFGYNNLVVDFRGIHIMQQTGCPVVFDATHSVQLPGGAGTRSGGQREFAPVLARAAVAAGADGVFLEVHEDPDKALCDGPNSLPLDQLPGLLTQLKAIKTALTA